MVRSTSIRLLLLAVVIGIISCGKPTPEKYFDVAVLNTNMVVGFANDGMERELASPSVKMGKTKHEILPMKRSEVIDSKIKFVEENYEKLKGFSPSGDEKAIVQQSLTLHQFVLEVYKSDYTALAKLYDEDADKETIQQKQADIKEKYASKFEALYEQLMNSGKEYAAAHKIKVNWAL